MKKWVLLIFSINKSLDRQCEKLEKKIEKLSLNSALPTQQLYSEIVALSDKKADLINLRVLYNLMAQSLCSADLAAVLSVAEKGRSTLNGLRAPLDFADDLKKNSSSCGSQASSDKDKPNSDCLKHGGAITAKRLSEILGRCERMIADAGFTAERFERLYPQFVQKKSA